MNVFTCLHVCNAKKLDILADLRVRPSQVWAGHGDEVAKATLQTTVATADVCVGFGVAFVF